MLFVAKFSAMDLVIIFSAAFAISLFSKIIIIIKKGFVAKIKKTKFHVNMTFF